MNKKILVTGSSGQLGLTIRDLSFKLEDEVDFVFANKSQIDISDNLILENLFKEIEFDFCINCAAYTNVEQAEINPEEAFRVNADAVKCLAQICAKFNTILIHISTDYVFDGESNEPYTEIAKTKPINKYGESKLKGELHLKELLANYYIIRTSWLYSKYGNNFLKSIIKKINSNSELDITTDQIGTPSSCIDLTTFIFYLIHNKSKVPYGIYNFSAIGETTWYQYSKHIAKHFNHYNSNKIRPTKEFKTKARRPKYSVLNNSKIRNLNYEISDWEVSVTYLINQVLKS